MGSYLIQADDAVLHELVGRHKRVELCSEHTLNVMCAVGEDDAVAILGADLLHINDLHGNIAVGGEMRRL